MPVDYEMAHHNPSQKKSIGFIAQDVQRLFPELVTVITDTSHGYKGLTDLHAINYDGFGVLAIKAIQEQQAILQTQDQKIKLQQQSLDELISELKAIKSFIKATITHKN